MDTPTRPCSLTAFAVRHHHFMAAVEEVVQQLSDAVEPADLLVVAVVAMWAWLVHRRGLGLWATAHALTRDRLGY